MSSTLPIVRKESRQTGTEPHPRIARRWEEARLHRVSLLDKKLHYVLREFCNTISSYRELFGDGARIIDDIEKMIYYLDCSEPHLSDGQFVRQKIATFLIDQQSNLEIMSAHLILNAKIVEIIRDLTKLMSPYIHIEGEKCAMLQHRLDRPETGAAVACHKAQ